MEKNIKKAYVITRIDDISKEEKTICALRFKSWASKAKNILNERTDGGFYENATYKMSEEPAEIDTTKIRYYSNYNRFFDDLGKAF